MRLIHLANTAKRDAEVGFVPAPKRERAVLTLPDGERPSSVRFIKRTVSIDSLVEEFGGLPEVGQAIVDGDPEVDIEAVGKFIESPLRMYLTKDGDIAYRVRLEDVVFNADGSEKERREHTRNASNIAVEAPIRPSKMVLPIADAVRRFVFSRHYQLTHTNGLSYDFLFQMASELHTSGTMVLVGSGPQGTGPLVLTTGGDPYRGFLEGRIEGERYSLVLHLSNQELRVPAGGEK